MIGLFGGEAKPTAEAVENEKKNEDSESEEDDILDNPVLKENPYLYLGFGMTIYFKILSTLIFTFVAFSILSMINLGIYSSYKAYDSDSQARYTIGNMGFS